MLTRLLACIISTSPAARKFLWRWWYNRLARQVPTDDWTFMNYGFVWPEDEPPVTLSPADESDRLCAQLYHRVAAPGALRGKDVLEVGAGRGGGASYVARYLAPATMTAVDLSSEAVALCAKRHVAPNLKFLEGDAERLPFADASFDAVLNVESSHCYASMESFVREVSRLLRPGGVFLIADLRDAKEMPDLEALFAAQPALEVVEREDLTARVAAALRADDARKRAKILELCPPGQRGLFSQFAGLAGSLIHRGFEARTILYHRFVLRKKKLSTLNSQL